MTPSLRSAGVCGAAAVLLLAAAGYAGAHHPVLALPGLYAAGMFGCCAARARTGHRRRTVRALRAERLARPRAEEPLSPGLAPCCAFWRHSDGAVHGPDCTRPAAARYPLPHDCCELWWTSLGARHEEDCRRQVGTGRQGGARRTSR